MHQIDSEDQEFLTRLEALRNTAWFRRQQESLPPRSERSFREILAELPKLDEEAADEIARAIEEGCERIDDRR